MRRFGSFAEDLAAVAVVFGGRRLRDEVVLDVTGRERQRRVVVRDRLSVVARGTAVVDGGAAATSATVGHAQALLVYVLVGEDVFFTPRYEVRGEPVEIREDDARRSRRVYGDRRAAAFALEDDVATRVADSLDGVRLDRRFRVRHLLQHFQLRSEVRVRVRQKAMQS